MEFHTLYDSDNVVFFALFRRNWPTYETVAGERNLWQSKMGFEQIQIIVPTGFYKNTTIQSCVDLSANGSTASYVRSRWLVGLPQRRIAEVIRGLSLCCRVKDPVIGVKVFIAHHPTQVRHTCLIGCLFFQFVAIAFIEWISHWRPCASNMSVFYKTGQIHKGFELHDRGYLAGLIIYSTKSQSQLWWKQWERELSIYLTNLKNSR